MAFRPQIIGPPIPASKLEQTEQAHGRTVSRIDFGIRTVLQAVHDSEAMIIHFTDGSSLTIDVGCNAVNVAEEHPGLDPSEFRTDLAVYFRPKDAAR